MKGAVRDGVGWLGVFVDVLTCVLACGTSTMFRGAGMVFRWVNRTRQQAETMETVGRIGQRKDKSLPRTT